MILTADITISDALTSEGKILEGEVSEGKVSEAKISETGEPDDDDVPEPSLLKIWANAAYLNKKPAVASLLVTTSTEIQNLNKQYRDKDKATNVLSFPMQSPKEVDVCLLGDIVLCAAVIEQEAVQQSKNRTSHWAHMVVHGMLHLQGYDHIQNDEAEVMERLEINILNQLGFDNPYDDGDEKR
ncbi:Metal-dependent hydrolase YbeY, involved in rRNA and/or ribosome maturation and assembly [hydrothermal vent metagenome]|uniref:Metal-dependent hydrolase YbeY, involved in rRNA and/or ribosome maturation and assembly n=1 Tax=hydrothermal vent metagenome TaxID=652676 RepID=A0A3B0X0C2_9ZZZZ